MDVEMAIEAQAESTPAAVAAAPAAEPGHPDGTKYKLVSANLTSCATTDYTSVFPHQS